LTGSLRGPRRRPKGRVPCAVRAPVRRTCEANRQAVPQRGPSRGARPDRARLSAADPAPGPPHLETARRCRAASLLRPQMAVIGRMPTARPVWCNGRRPGRSATSAQPARHAGHRFPPKARRHGPVSGRLAGVTAPQLSPDGPSSRIAHAIFSSGWKLPGFADGQMPGPDRTNGGREPRSVASSDGLGSHDLLLSPPSPSIGHGSGTPRAAVPGH